jgi:valyl-tRNA synthetase
MTERRTVSPSPSSGSLEAGGTIKQGYDPRGVEERWYAFWEAQGFFHADEDSARPPYTIVIPLPNVTGSLHMGHALNNTLQDILIRWQRMQGKNTLWMPGTDHAGIATQYVVEKQLAQEGKRREDLGREAFIQRVWKWKEESGGTIIKQLKRLGASCDWARECFTMDPPRSQAVVEAFVGLWGAGLLYRAERLINWCPRCQTALADLEVEHEEEEGRLWHIRYPFADDATRGLTVATTRPETMLGDTAVAVHPEDARYRDAIGRTVRLPLVGRMLPVIADPAVDQEFGTGAVKVTPAHDPNDFEIGKRHGLPIVGAFQPDGRIADTFLVDERGAPIGNAPAARYVGRDRAEVRRMVVRDLAEEGLLVKEEPHRHAVGHCHRCGTVIEPFLTPQWFIRTQPLAQPAIRAVEEGRVRIVPEQWERNYFEWMRNIRDWCISRQIWWGHRIPAWYCLDCDAAVGRTEAGQPAIGAEAHPIVAREAPRACPRCGSGHLLQDPDVLDTWFSSALWPFSTLGWPERTKALRVFYPTSTLVTAFDILFFWVARMIMMGLHFMGDVPFRDVYIHGLIRDEQGEKMSKTRGNVIDPLHVIHGATLEELVAAARAGGAPPAALEGIRRQFPDGFPPFGADALRFTLAALASQGSDVKLSVKRIEGYRHFCNKIWNAYRFVAGHLGDEDPRTVRLGDLPLTLADRWILTRLTQVTEGVTEALRGYRFNDAASVLYQFLWHEYCDWYLEIVKNRLAAAEDQATQRTGRVLLARVLEQSLRLLHPIMPFITEEIWQRLPHDGVSIMVAPWPQPEPALQWPQAVEAMETLMEITREVRNIRSTYNIAPSQRLPLVLRTSSPNHAAILESCQGYLASLARLSQFTWGQDVAKPKVAAAAVIKGIEAYVPLEGLIDFREERERLRRELAKVEQGLDRVTRKLSNEEFLGKAPPAVVSREKGARAELVDAQAKLRESLTRIEAHLKG